MAKTIPQLTALGATPDDTDNLVIDDAGVTKRVTAAELKGDCVRSQKNNALSTTVGTRIGTGTSQLLGFWNATPVDQPALTADLLDSLQEVGLIASGAGNTPLNLSSGALACGAVACGAVTCDSVTSTNAVTCGSVTSTNAVTCGSVASTGAIRSSSSSAGIGYSTGAGGTVTQSGGAKSNPVTLNAATGRITMNISGINTGTTASFTLTNSAIAANDLLVLNHVSGGTAGAYTLNAQAAAGSASINVRNVTANNLSEAIVIGFAVIKSVTS
jgi:hypothetical protein